MQQRWWMQYASTCSAGACAACCAAGSSTQRDAPEAGRPCSAWLSMLTTVLALKPLLHGVPTWLSAGSACAPWVL